MKSLREMESQKRLRKDAGNVLLVSEYEVRTSEEKGQGRSGRWDGDGMTGKDFRTPIKIHCKEVILQQVRQEHRDGMWEKK